MLKVRTYKKQTQNGNLVCINNPEGLYVEIIHEGRRGFYKTIHQDIEPDTIQMSNFARQHLNVTLSDKVKPEYSNMLHSYTQEVEIKVKMIEKKNIDYNQVVDDMRGLKKKFESTPVFNGSTFFFNGYENSYLFTIETKLDTPYIFISKYEIIYTYEEKNLDRVMDEANNILKKMNDRATRGVGGDKGGRGRSESQKSEEVEEYQKSIFEEGVNFSDLDIGGLDEQIKRIMRIIFANRILKQEAEEMGISSPRGILMYGPPGNGKTLIARQLASIIKAEFQIFNGPELISKYVGESAANARKIFEPAEEAMRNGSNKLFVYAFDEADSLFATRSSSDSVGKTTTNDVVNTLLSKIDGLNTLNNILIIAMTNNKHMIDPAMLRPGRLEVHIEIPLANREGRIKIFNIHAKNLKNNGYLGEDVDFESLADRTVNFSGAEIKAVVSNATSYPLTKMIDPTTMKRVSNEKPIVKMIDFISAISEINPTMGSSNKDIDTITETELILDDFNFVGIYNQIRDNIKKYLEEGNSKCRGRNFTILLSGDNFTGKTKMVAHIVKEFTNMFSHTKFLTPESFVRENLSVWKSYSDGLYSEEFLFVVDSIETVFDYSSGGYIQGHTRELMTIINANVKSDKKVVTIITCSNMEMIETLGLDKKVTLFFNLSGYF